MKNVRITHDDMGQMTIEMDGEKLEGIAGYALTCSARPGENMPLLVLQVNRPLAEFEGIAEIAIDRRDFDALGEMIGLLGEIDAGTIERAALADMDWDGEEYGTTKAILAQLKKWLEAGRT